MDSKETVNPADIEIVRPDETDLSTIFDLWKEQHTYHLNLDPTYYTENSSDIFEKAERYFKEVVRTDTPHILVAKLDKAVVGFITFAEPPQPSGEENVVDFGSNLSRCGEIIDLIVTEKIRERAIGTQLLDKAEEELKTKGVQFIKVEVASTNNGARRFYERYNYVPRQVLSYKKL